MVIALRKPKTKLYHYVLHPPSGARRLHLRMHRDGSAVLFIDVTDVIHLNPTAALLVHSALEGKSLNQAVARLRRQYRAVSEVALRSDAAAMFRLVERLRSGGGCPTCALAECGRTPPFSTPVSAPYKADLALTYGCNNACAHCYNGVRNPANRSLPIKTPRDGGPGACTWQSLTLSQWKKVLKKLARIGVPHVIFTGGEPTLFPGLCELIRHAGRLNLVTGLNTNGRRLAEPDFAQNLRQIGLQHVQITIESCRPEVHNAMTGADSFAETAAGIRCALAAGLHTLTNTTLTRHNVDQAEELIVYLAQLGVKTIAVNAIIRAGGGSKYDAALSPEELAAVVPDLRDAAHRHEMRFLWYTPTPYCRFSPLRFDLGPRRCNAGQYSFCIEPDGGVLPCQSHPVSVGNILRDPWDSLWNSDMFLRFRKRNENPQAAGLPERCWTCPDLPACGGGCPLDIPPSPFGRGAGGEGGDDHAFTSLHNYPNQRPSP